MFEHLDRYSNSRTWRGGQGFWKKLQKFVRVRMNSSSMLDMKLIKDLKVWDEFYELFEKIVFAEVISSSNYFLFFEAKFKFGRIISDFLTSGLDFGNFCEGKLGGFLSVFFVLLFSIGWLGVSERYS